MIHIADVPTMMSADDADAFPTGEALCVACISHLFHCCTRFSSYKRVKRTTHLPQAKNFFMPFLVGNMSGKTMNRGSQAASTKVERRIIEKNRRNQMKILYSKLNLLLPDLDSKPKEALSVPDQIDEAINYIKSLETKLKMYEEKKESLMGRKRSSPCTNIEATANPRAPQIEVREMGSTLQIVLITRPDNQFLFSEVIHILYEEQAEVLNASYSASGDSILHVVYAEMARNSFDFGATKVTERLKGLVYGSTSDVELQPDLWDFDIYSGPWNLQI